jgi:hypothetical protein
LLHWFIAWHGNCTSDHEARCSYLHETEKKKPGDDMSHYSAGAASGKALQQASSSLIITPLHTVLETT